MQVAKEDMKVQEETIPLFNLYSPNITICNIFLKNLAQSAAHDLLSAARICFVHRHLLIFFFK